MASSDSCDKEACATKRPTKYMLLSKAISTNVSNWQFEWEGSYVFYKGLPQHYEWTCGKLTKYSDLGILYLCRLGPLFTILLLNLVQCCSRDDQIVLSFDMRVASSAAEALVKYQNDTIISARVWYFARIDEVLLFNEYRPGSGVMDHVSRSGELVKPGQILSTCMILDIFSALTPLKRRQKLFNSS